MRKSVLLNKPPSRNPKIPVSRPKLDKGGPGCPQHRQLERRQVVQQSCWQAKPSRTELSQARLSSDDLWRSRAQLVCDTT